MYAHHLYLNGKEITDLVVSEDVTSINPHVFSGCEGLTSVTIPESVTSIGDGAFEGCSGLVDVYCLAEEVPETSSDAFNSSTIGSATLHVLASVLDAYKTTEPWSGFGKIVALTEEEVDGIKDLRDSKGFKDLKDYWHSLDGRRLPAPQRGLNIIRHADGTARKVLMK